MPACNNDEENAMVNKARALVATYEDMAELIRLGAYRKGTSEDVDEAMFYYPQIEAFMAQKKKEKIDFETGYKQLKEILDKKPS